ncbi:LLM class flavin-dependent oxidoreductase [Haloactinopolyspora sp.]|uniref:LLM class flavin-dependent oxidoreductase n=1 Tax=Haloactinopolyspora sp. TaxID=1966353 RepID=UPI0026267536|nr:LLM class flavin-dependent oxidoreductase [Haloactinopolyspora sp.]
MAKDDIVLSATLMGLGMHLGSWMVRDGDASDYVRADFYQACARAAERGRFHCLFLADTLSSSEEGVERPALGALDPVTALMSMAAVTEHIGLVGTASTTFNQPFDLARRFSTFDHLSNGRAGWNAVATFVPAVADNFGSGVLPDRRDRYERADEFLDVAFKLWDSWDDDALVGNKSEAIFGDPAKVREIGHAGKYYQVRGPLTLPRSPQGRPIVFQAGSSAEGKQLAGKYADVVFTAQSSPADGALFRKDVRASAESHGRAADDVIILPGLLPIMGSTEAEAKARKEALDDALGTEPEMGKLARRVGVAIEDLDLDKPLPLDKLVPDDQFAGSIGFRRSVVGLAERENLTVRELLKRYGGGHNQVVGTPEQVADEMQRWLAEDAADGFNLMIDMLPDGIEMATDQLVPELRRRGLFRNEYSGATFRENLGLAYPDRRNAS